MNRYPLWKYAILLVALLMSAIYALPNLLANRLPCRCRRPGPRCGSTAARLYRVARISSVRNPHAFRPWQHVLEPLSGYLTLAAQLAAADNESRIVELCSPFNFGPNEQSHQSVQQLVEAIIAHWTLKAGPAKWIDRSDPNALHEAKLLSLDTGKAKRLLNWSNRWDFAKTVGETVQWYREVHGEGNASEVTLRQIEDFEHSV